MSASRTTTWIALGMLLASAAHAETFYDKDGIRFEGTIRQVLSEAAVCNVLEEKYTAQEYEQLKAHQGRPLHVWRVDFSVRNGSGRELDFLRADSWVRSEWPPCTNWDGPQAGTLEPFIAMHWADTLEVLGMPYGMRVDQEQRRALYVLAFDGHRPRFGEWDINYTFAAGSGGVNAPPPAPAAPPAARQPATRTTAEQENLFWQSIMNSNNPAEFEAYLAHFPEGVFRTLAETRLASLRAAPGDAGLPRTGTELGGAATRDRVAEMRSPGGTFPPGAEAICAGKTNATPCWKELTSHPGCYVWDDFYPTDLYFSEVLGTETVRDYFHHHAWEQSVTWSGECSGGVASGTGTLKWIRKKFPEDRIYTLVYRADEHASTGLLRDGRANGRWVLFRRANEDDGSLSFERVEEGPYANGKRQGHWVKRTHWDEGSENAEEGPYVDGKRHGHWTERTSQHDGFGWVDQGLFVHGRMHGDWVTRYTSGNSRTVTFVNGKRQ